MRVALHHVEINVSNIHHTREFWGWFLQKLGYQEEENMDKGIVNYRLGDTYMVFVQRKKNF